MYAYVPRNAQLSGCMWMQVYRQDSFGRDIIQGYGSMLVPTVAGRYTRYVRMFAPVSSSPFQSMLVWLTGNKPEVRQLCCASLIPHLLRSHGWAAMWGDSSTTQSSSLAAMGVKVSYVLCVVCYALCACVLVCDSSSPTPPLRALAVTRVEAAGLVKVSVNVMTRGMSAFGYATGGPADAGAAPTAGAGAGAGAGGRLRRV